MTRPAPLDYDRDEDDEPVVSPASRVSPGPGTSEGAADLVVTGPVWYWRGPAPFHFLRVSPEDSAGLRAVSADVTYGWGMIPVTATLGGTRWTTALFPKDGGYLVPIKDRVRSAEEIGVDDVVTVAVVVGDAR